MSTPNEHIAAGFEPPGNDQPTATATPTQVWESALAAFMAQPEDRMWGEAAAEVIAGTLEPLRTKIANQAERIRYLEGATNHATGTPLSHARARVDTLERELSSAQAALAEAKADNESLRTLWTEIRTVLIQSRAANCVCSYGAQQADAVEAANAVLKRMPPDVTNERDQLRAALTVAEEALKSQRDWWHQLPGGIYENPDIEETSPEDASAHVGGLAVAELDQALARIAETRKGRP